MLSATAALCSQWEERGEDPGVWPTNALFPASPTSSVEGDRSLHKPKRCWMIAVTINTVGVITDLASYVSSPGPSSMQVDPFTRQTDLLVSLYIFM